MGTVIVFIIAAVVLYLLYKKFSPEALSEEAKLRKEFPELFSDDDDDEDTPSLQVTMTATRSHTTTTDTENRPKRTSADILEELLDDDLWQVIEVDAELIFKHANFKDQYYLHATHYFPEREEVYGENANGKIVWVDLYGQKEATHPETGERIPGIKRYLRQNAIK